MRYMIGIIAFSLASLSACDLTDTTQISETQPAVIAETPVRSVQAAAPTKRAEIDWDAARQDFAARNTGDDTTLMIAGSANPPVPVLLPDQPITIASTEGSGLQFRPTADGYFAIVPGDTYDLIINGSDRLIAGPNDLADAIVGEMQFQETLTGAQVSFQRYGASYLAEFMCKAPDTASRGSCISAEAAQQVVTELLVSGTR